MLKAIKGPRELDILENDVKTYKSDGYKIVDIDEKGKVKILHDPAKASKKDEELTKQVEELTAENEELTKQVEKLKAEVAKLKK
jgi:predicted RNase H-like nuclease (RuvC/YqgF family)